jgi:general secretion pathway protein H
MAIQKPTIRPMNPPRSPTGESGFTLLELLVTMTVAGLLIAVVAPRLLDTAGHARLKASAARVSVALRETRAMARRTDAAASLSLDPTGKGYVLGGQSYTLPSGQTVTLKPYFDEPDASKTIMSFLPDGSSSGGTLLLAHGGDSVRVDVDWLTGRISTGD